jgi:hypothetical protein
MRRRAGVAIQVLALLLLSVSPFPLFAQAAKPPSQPAEGPPAAQQGEAPAEVLTNSDVLKMAKVKLGDGIIINKIKTSACNFDTSVDALVKLKEAGVSDAVIQAMHDAQEAAKAVPEPSAPVDPSPVSRSTGPAPALHDGNPALLLPTASGRTFAVDLVDHDGERALRLRVRHNQMSNCSGYLYISHNRIAYDPLETPNQKDAFNLQRGEIKKAAINKCTIGGCISVGIWTAKKAYFFFPLFDLGAGNKSGIRQNLEDTVRDGPVYEFIGRSLSDFDTVLHEAETLTANLTRRP